jgi:threonine/homoserine/homoserine lactone efflux protein
VGADTLLALISFAIAGAFTPGPNNIMLAASGMNFGFTRSAPHMAGIVVGFVVMLLSVGFGLGSLFAAYPAAQAALKTVGVAYLLWLAWRIANAAPADPSARSRPLKFIEAALFQWVNPKGLLAVFGAMSIFIRPEEAVSDVLTVALVFFAVSIGAVLTWTVFGTALRSFIRDRRKLRIFNIAMALLLVASIVPMVLPFGGGDGLF